MTLEDIDIDKIITNFKDKYNTLWTSTQLMDFLYQHYDQDAASLTFKIISILYDLNTIEYIGYERSNTINIVYRWNKDFK